MQRAGNARSPVARKMREQGTRHPGEASSGDHAGIAEGHMAVSTGPRTQQGSVKD